MRAGELEVDDQQRLIRRSNLSGTYQCPDWMSVQANLPLDRLVNSQTMEDVPTLHRSVRFRALAFTEAELVNEKKTWAAHLGSMPSANKEAADCQARLNQITEKQKAAMTSMVTCVL